MYFNELETRLQDYVLGNKINEKGYVTKEQDENFKLVLPPKKMEEYKSEEEYNKAVSEFNEFKKQCQAFYDATKKGAEYALNPDPKTLFTKAEVKKVINQVNNVNKGKEDEGKVTFNENIDLTDKEVQERTANHNEAVKTMAEADALFKVGAGLIAKYTNNPDTRPAQILFMSGVKNLDDLYKDFNTLVNGTLQEKNKMFERKYNVMRNAAFEMCEQKSDAEYNSFFKENFLTVFGLNELHPDKIAAVQKQLGFQYNDNIVKEVKKQYNNFTTMGSEHRILANMANPYYPIFKENIYKFSEALRGADALDQSVNNELYSKMYMGTAYLAETLDEAQDENKPIIDYFGKYMANQGFGKQAHAFTPDFANIYFLKNKDIITKIVNDKGKIITGTSEELAQKTAEQLVEGKGVLLYDKLGNFKGKMQVVNHDLCDVPSTYKGLKTVNFKMENTVQQIKNLKTEFSKVESFFSLDHQEFKNVKKYIDNMESAYKKGTSLSELCHGLRGLAQKYMESKYDAKTPEKTKRTFDREAFMCNLIGSIDNKYPIRYPQTITEKRIDNLKNPSENDKKFLQDIINKNNAGYSKAEVETYIDNKIKVVGDNRKQFDLGINDEEDEIEGMDNYSNDKQKVVQNNKELQ